MKQVVIVGLILVALSVAGFWYLSGKFNEDPGLLVGMVVGSVQNDVHELHIVVSMGVVRAEGPPVAPSGALLWEDWIKLHFDLRDASGQAVSLSRMGSSPLINERKALNPEFYLRATLPAGRTYTLTYQPRLYEPKRYRHTFSVPPEGLPYQREHFDTIDAE